MGLVDADALKKDLKSVTLSNGTLVNTNAVLYLLEEYPTAYDLDKVVKQLEEEKEYSNADFEGYAEEHGLDSDDDWYYIGLKRAIEIVKAGGADGN